MNQVMSKSLSEKTVVDADGADVGRLHNITINFTTGELENLLVTPDGNPAEQQRHRSKYKTSDQGRYMIECSRVEAVRDHIVVR